MNAPRVLVIGAGPAGLAVARRLRERGLAYDQVEAHDGAGGIWDIDSSGSPMYDSAHFISSKTLSGMPGYPMPSEYPDYPNHRQLLEYLRSFARHFELTDHIRCGTEVVGVDRAPDASWTVRFADGSQASYDAVIPATGMLQTPSIPELPGDFDGEVLHTKNYRDPEIF